MMREACGESLEPARFWLAPVDTGNQIHFMIMEKVSILQWASISPCVNISQRMLPHAYQQLKAHWLGFAEKNVGTWKAMPGLCMVNSAKICAQHLERISWLVSTEHRWSFLIQAQKQVMPQLHPGMSENQTVRGWAIGAKSKGKVMEIFF